jgi:hypothetical protein
MVKYEKFLDEYKKEKNNESSKYFNRFIFSSLATLIFILLLINLNFLSISIFLMSIVSTI